MPPSTNNKPLLRHKKKRHKIPLKMKEQCCFAEYALCLLFIPSAFPYAILYIMRDSNLGKMCVLWERTQEQRTERV